MSGEGGGGGAFIRGRKRSYTIVWDDDFVEGMSARAWGVYCYLVGKPEGWTCRVYDLMKHFKEGRDALVTAVHELVDLGLLVKEPYLDGGLRRWRYRLDDDGPADDEPSATEAEKPRSAPGPDFQGPGNPAPGNQAPGKPGPENPPGVSKEEATTDQATTDQGGAARAARPSDGDALDGMPPAPPSGGGGATRRGRRRADEPHPLDVAAETLTRARFDAVTPTPPGYIAAKQVIRAMLGNGYDPAWLSTALWLLLREGRTVSGGTMQVALEQAYDRADCPDQVREAARPIVEGWRAARAERGDGRRPARRAGTYLPADGNDPVHDERRAAFGAAG